MKQFAYVNDWYERKGKEQSSSRNTQEEGRVRKGQKRSSDGCEKPSNREKEDSDEEIAVTRELRTRPGEVVEVKRGEQRRLLEIIVKADAEDSAEEFKQFSVSSILSGGFSLMQIIFSIFKSLLCSLVILE